MAFICMETGRAHGNWCHMAHRKPSLKNVKASTKSDMTSKTRIIASEPALYALNLLPPILLSSNREPEGLSERSERKNNLAIFAHVSPHWPSEPVSISSTCLHENTRSELAERVAAQELATEGERAFITTLTKVRVYVLVAKPPEH